MSLEAARGLGNEHASISVTAVDGHVSRSARHVDAPNTPLPTTITVFGGLLMLFSVGGLACVVILVTRRRMTTGRDLITGARSRRVVMFLIENESLYTWGITLNGLARESAMNLACSTYVSITHKGKNYA